MNDKIADHLLELMREAEEDYSADDELVGDTYKLVDNVRRGQIAEPIGLLARDSDYKMAFEYLLGVADGVARAADALERPESIEAAVKSAAEVEG